MVEQFAGKFTVSDRENFDKFMVAVGVPEEFVEKARQSTVITEIKVNGKEVTVTRTRPIKTTTNTFTLDEETEIDTIKGDKVKVLVTFKDGKLVAKGAKYEVITEMDDKGRLKETITMDENTMTRWSVRS